jgi:hypothetical protein
MFEDIIGNSDRYRVSKDKVNVIVEFLVESFCPYDDEDCPSGLDDFVEEECRDCILRWITA